VMMVFNMLAYRSLFGKEPPAAVPALPSA